MRVGHVDDHSVGQRCLAAAVLDDTPFGRQGNSLSLPVHFPVVRVFQTEFVPLVRRERPRRRRRLTPRGRSRPDFRRRGQRQHFPAHRLELD